MKRVSGISAEWWKIAVAVGLIVYLWSQPGLRPNLAQGQTSAGEPAPLGLSPTPAPAAGFPSESLPLSEAIELIWYGEYERAEAALQWNLQGAGESSIRAEIYVYLALLSSIRQQPDMTSNYLREALLQVPVGIELDPVQFPPRLRGQLDEIESELRSQRARPKDGELPDPVHVLSPPATPPGAGAGPRRWYQRWYVWAGVAAAATVAVILVSGGGDEEPTATPTPTPTSMPTATPTPTQFSYEETIVQVPSCDGANDPFQGGQTFHRFDLRDRFEDPTTIEIIEASLRAEVVGDYGPVSEGEDKRAFVLIERDGRYVQQEGSAFCSPIGPLVLSQSEPDLIRQLHVALRDTETPGLIEIVIQPATDVIENCKNACNPVHRVELQLEYRFR